MQENWVDTSHGLGLQGAVVSDLFPSDYMGGAVDPDGFYQKTQDSYVGKCRIFFYLSCSPVLTTIVVRIITGPMLTVNTQIHH